VTRLPALVSDSIIIGDWHIHIDFDLIMILAGGKVMVMLVGFSGERVTAVSRALKKKDQWQGILVRTSKVLFE
jgi:hypothetical protein